VRLYETRGGSVRARRSLFTDRLSERHSSRSTILEVANSIERVYDDQQYGYSAERG
jgi:hypothetical protein